MEKIRGSLSWMLPLRWAALSQMHFQFPRNPPASDRPVPPLLIGVNSEIQPIFNWGFGCTRVVFSCRLSRLGTCLHFCREPAESKTPQRQISCFFIYQLEISTEFLPRGHFLYIYFQSTAFICAIRVRTKELPHVACSVLFPQHHLFDETLEMLCQCHVHE